VKPDSFQSFADDLARSDGVAAIKLLPGILIDAHQLFPLDNSHTCI
jgi:hypothetical protein